MSENSSSTDLDYFSIIKDEIATVFESDLFDDSIPAPEGAHIEKFGLSKHWSFAFSDEFDYIDPELSDSVCKIKELLKSENSDVCSRIIQKYNLDIPKNFSIRDLIETGNAAAVSEYESSEEEICRKFDNVSFKESVSIFYMGPDSDGIHSAIILSSITLEGADELNLSLTRGKTVDVGFAWFDEDSFFEAFQNALNSACKPFSKKD